MKIDIFAIVFGAVMVATAFVVPPFWCAYFTTIGAIGLVNGVFGLCYHYQGNLMSKPDPLPFTVSPQCPKCWRYISSLAVRYKKGILRLKCGGCRYKFTMLPRDHFRRGRY